MWRISFENGDGGKLILGGMRLYSRFMGKFSDRVSQSRCADRQKGMDIVYGAELGRCSIPGFGGIVAALGNWGADAEATENESIL